MAAGVVVTLCKISIYGEIAVERAARKLFDKLTVAKAARM